jgi:hypothetical protein
MAPRHRRQQTAANALTEDAWIRDITGPLTVPVLVQYLELHQRLQQVQLNKQQPDWILWHWNASGQYSSTSAYAALQLGQVPIEGCRQLWKVRAPNACHFFTWLVFLGRY